MPPSPFSPRDIPGSFRKVYLEVCARGYSVLGRSPGQLPEHLMEWHHRPARPLSYQAQARYRFLKTQAAVRTLPHLSVLEVAAGGGFNGICLFEPGKRVVLNDLRYLEEEIGLWPPAPHLEVVPGNLFDLDPERLGRFDLVLACEVIEHIAHGDRFIRHLRRFLRPEGILLITTPNGAYFRSKLPTYSQIRDFGALEALQFRPDADGHLYLYTPEELESLLGRCGFGAIRLDLSITPWLSGHAGFRFLPGWRSLAPLYFELDSLTRRLGRRARRRLCTQLIATAQAP